jgi:hypothetical protein
VNVRFGSLLRHHETATPRQSGLLEGDVQPWRAAHRQRALKALLEHDVVLTVVLDHAPPEGLDL